MQRHSWIFLLHDFSKTVFFELPPALAGGTKSFAHPGFSPNFLFSCSFNTMPTKSGYGAKALREVTYIHGLKPVAIQLKSIEWLNFTWEPCPIKNFLICSFPKKSEGFFLRVLSAFVVKSFFGISMFCYLFTIFPSLKKVVHFSTRLEGMVACFIALKFVYNACLP